MDIHFTNTESFKVTLVDTGLNTKTAGRLKKIQYYVGNEDFMLTYGDGVADIDLNKLLTFHKSHGKIATVTAIQPEARFGGMDLAENGMVNSFKEKPKEDDKWINGGFFVLKPEVFKYLDGNMEEIMWEDDPMERLAQDDQLMAYRHHGFWKCMDAMRDKLELGIFMEKQSGKMENLVTLEKLSGYFNNKKVFITGHTGFKGSWLMCWLHLLGARIKGYALPPEYENNIYDQLRQTTRLKVL